MFVKGYGIVIYMRMKRGLVWDKIHPVGRSRLLIEVESDLNQSGRME